MLTVGRLEAEAFIGERGSDAAARRAGDIAFLHQIGLDHVFDGVARFGERGGERVGADGAAGIGFDEGMEVAPVERVETVAVDLEAFQRAISGGLVDRLALGVRKVPHPAQQAQRDARRAAGARRNLDGAFLRDRSTELAGSGHDDTGEFFGLVEIETDRNAEPVAQGRREEARASGGADEREGRKIKPHGAGGGAFPDHQIERVVFHCRIEDFLHDRGQAVDLVDEEDIVRIKVCQDRGEVAGLGDDRAGSRAEADAHLAREDLREGCLAEAGGAEEEHMVERLAAPAGGIDIDFQVRLGLALADIVLERLGTQRPVQRVRRLGLRIGEGVLAGHRASSLRAPLTRALTLSALPSLATAATAREASDGV